MLGLKVFVRVQTFRRAPPVLPCNFCHPDAWKLWYFFLQKQHLTCIPNVKSFPVYRRKWAKELDLRKWESVSFKATAARRSRVFLKQLQLTQLLQQITNNQYIKYMINMIWLCINDIFKATTARRSRASLLEATSTHTAATKIKS